MERYDQHWSQTMEAIKGRSHKQNWVEKETQNKHRSRVIHFKWNWQVKRMMINCRYETIHLALPIEIIFGKIGPHPMWPKKGKKNLYFRNFCPMELVLSRTTCLFVLFELFMFISSFPISCNYAFGHDCATSHQLTTKPSTRLFYTYFLAKQLLLGSSGIVWGTKSHAVPYFGQENLGTKRWAVYIVRSGTQMYTKSAKYTK